MHVLLTKPLLLLLPPLHSHRHMAMHGTRRRATTPMVVACLLACTGKIPTDRPTDQVLGRVCVRRARIGGGWILARHANRPTTTTPPPPLAVRAIRALSSLAVHAVCVCAATTTASSSSTFPPHCRRSRHRLVYVHAHKKRAVAAGWWRQKSWLCQLWFLILLLSETAMTLLCAVPCYQLVGSCLPNTLRRHLKVQGSNPGWDGHPVG